MVNPRDQPAPTSQHDQLLDRARAPLVAALEAAGWGVSRSASSSRPGLLARKASRAYAIELRASPGRARRGILRALLADAILQARARAASLGAEPLAVLVAPSISQPMARELGDYVRQFAPGMAWGLLDDRGRFELHAPGLDAVQPASRDALIEREPALEASAHNPFSDLGQWMLKVLLASHIPERWLHAPREPLRGVSDLAARARVSPSRASQFLSALEAGGYLVRSRGTIRLVRVEALLEAWRVACGRPVEERPARFLLPGPEPARRLRELLARRARPANLDGQLSPQPVQHAGPPGWRACLALFAACDALEVGFVRGVPLHLYAEDLGAPFLAQLELHPVEHRAEAELLVRRPHFPESVFRGCVLASDVPAADILQCWLDVSFHPARGAEQAAELASRLRVKEWES